MKLENYSIRNATWVGRYELRSLDSLTLVEWAKKNVIPTYPCEVLLGHF